MGYGSVSREMGQTKLEFIQSNLQHSKSATGVLSRCLAAQHTRVGLIQEPWVYRDRIRGLGGLRGTLIHDTKAEKLRAGLYLPREVKGFALPNLCSGDTAVAQIEANLGGHTMKLLIASVYLPFDSPTPPPSEELRRIVRYGRQHRIPMILGCDANAHHINWGSTDTNPRGAELMEFILANDLEIANRGQSPTFITRVRQQVLDVTLVSSEIVDLIKDWEVSKEASLSDHRHIRFNIRTARDKPRVRRNPKNTDWGLYRRHLERELGGMMTQVKTPNDVERVVTKLQTGMMGAFNKSCPPKRCTGKRRVPWWNDQLSVLRAESRRALRKALVTGTQGDWTNFHDTQREYKRVIKHAKRTSWREFCSGVKFMPETARLSKILRLDNRTQVGMLQLPSGAYTQTEQEALSHLLQIHFPNSVIAGEVDQGARGREGTWQDWNTAKRIVTKERVEWAISTFHPYKAPGEDGIYPAMLQEGLDTLIATLILLFQGCLATGYIPQAWTAVRVVFIPKPGKPTYDRAKSFRPISLTSFLLKTMERLVDRFIRDVIMRVRPLHPNQHAYQNGKSTETALHSVVGKVESALNRKSFALAAFFDIEGAFDNAPYDAIVRALETRGTPKTVSYWVESMLRQRTVTGSMGNYSVRAQVCRGCPQGGVLSPLLWCLVVDDLLCHLNSAGVFAQAYSDDGAILIVGPRLGTLSGQMNTALQKVDQWCRDRNLAINPDKVELMLFTRRYKVQGYRPVYLSGRELARKSHVKYLGVHLDPKLLWNKHIETKCNQATLVLAQCRRGIGKTWGITPRAAHWLYTAIVRPIITYAALVWWPKADQVQARKLLGRVQRLACACITGAMTTTSSAALDALLNLRPLHIHVKGEAMASCYRMMCNGQWEGEGASGGHLGIQGFLAEEIPETTLPRDTTKPTYLFNEQLALTIEDGAEQANHDVIYFCAGSRGTSPELSGSGIYCADPPLSIGCPLGHYASLFQADIFALLSAATHERQRGRMGTRVAFCSGNKAAILSLVAPKTNSNLVLEAKNMIAQVANQRAVKLVYLPGHMGSKGNKRAIDIARMNAQRPLVGPEPAVGLMQSQIKRAIELWKSRAHEISWRFAGCSQAKELMGDLNRQRATRLLYLDKNNLRLLTGVLTGHCALNRHLANMGLKQDPTCGLCLEEEESAMHFLAECVALAGIRQRVLSRPGIPSGMIRGLHVFDIVKYIKETDRFP